MTCDHVDAMCIYQCIINVVVVSHTGGGNQSLLVGLNANGVNYLIRLKIKPNSVKIRFLSCQIFVLPSTGFERANRWPSYAGSFTCCRIIIMVPVSLAALESKRFSKY
jgi:hypothetical protein